MKEPRWLMLKEVLAFHVQQLNEHGGLHGVRDQSLLESALNRPQNIFLYEQCNIFDLAAAYAYGIAKNHPFLDGNKRTAITSTGVFLLLNNYEFQIPEVEIVANMIELAAGKIKEKDFGEWLKSGSKRLEKI